MNQIGTVTESIKAHNMAKEQGWGTMVSHRSWYIFFSYFLTNASCQVWRDGGLLHCRPCCRTWYRPDQDWSSLQVPTYALCNKSTLINWYNAKSNWENDLTGLSVLRSTTSCSELRRSWAPMQSLQEPTSARLEILDVYISQTHLIFHPGSLKSCC